MSGEPNRADVATLSPELRAQSEALIRFVAQLVEPLARALPATAEVVLHDLSRLPNSIVAIAGNVTGREVGDPATDVLLRQLRSGNSTALVGYHTQLPGGREGRSTTMILRLETGEPVAAMCINSDVSQWRAASELLDGLLVEGGRAGRLTVPVSAPPAQHADDNASGEAFAHNVDELAATLIDQAISALGVPVELMKKRHKLEVVAELESRGMFMIRDAVDMSAAALGVTRYTIYNYLNEIAAERGAAPVRSSNARSGAS